MVDTIDPKQTARQSYTGQRMTKAEFEDAWAIAGILGREIKKSGSFYEARENYGFAFAKGKKIGPERAQDMLGDIFKARHGQTMNQMREGLIQREKTINPSAEAQALHHANKIEGLIRDGDTQPYYKALDQAAGAMADQHGITELSAKRMMKDAYAASEGKELSDIGKELEAAYHTPVAETQKADRRAVAIERRRQMPSR